MQMKVLFVSPLEGPWGGSEWLWAETALAFRRQGHEVGFFTPWPKGHSLVGELRASGAVEFYNNMPERWLRRLWRRSLDHRDARLRVLHEFRPDLVVISQPRQHEGVEWHPALLATNTPYAILNHLTVDSVYIDEALGEEITRFYSGARGVWFVSERSRRMFELQFGLALPEAKVARNPYRVSPTVEFTWPDADTIRLAMVARLDPDQKGHDIMFEVLARDPWRQRPISLHLYGDGSGGTRLRRLKNLLRLDNVHFEGFAQNVAAVWAVNHVVATPSRQEGMPIAMVEGMLMGRPVLGTGVAGIPELVEDGVSGFILRALDRELLDQALHRLWDRRGDLQAMGRAAQLRARTLMPPNPTEVFLGELLQLTRV